MSLFKTECRIEPEDAIQAKKLLEVAARGVLKNGEDEEGNGHYDVERINRVIDALGEADRILIDVSG